MTPAEAILSELKRLREFMSGGETIRGVVYANSIGGFVFYGAKPDTLEGCKNALLSFPRLLLAMEKLVEGMNTLRVAVEDKVRDPGAVSFIDKKLAEAARILKGER